MATNEMRQVCVTIRVCSNIVQGFHTVTVVATNAHTQMAEQKGGGGRGGGRGRKRRMRGFDEAVDDAAAAVIQASEMKRKRLSLAVAANKRRAKRS